MVKGNRTLCILDPLCKYATAADKRKPGSRYCDLDDLEDIVPDVFVPYHEEQLMGDEGTIFRFPLRKVPSEICDKPMDTDHLTSLLGQFKKEASRSLFFLNHIQKVLFSRVENGQIINEYSITIKMAPGDDSLKREFHAKRQKFAEIIKTRTQITAEPVLQIHTTITLLVSDQKTQQLEPDVETWFVVERIGFNKDDVPKEVHHAYSSGKLGLLPQGGVAVPLSKRTIEVQCFLCLTLPIETGLPMNVNGHFALNHEYRRNLWEDNKESIQVTWNRTLMSSVVAPSYIAAIVKQRDICKESTNTWNSEHYVRNQLTKYFKYLPSVNKAGDGNWKYMCTEIYRQIAKEICLFPTISTEVRKISSIIPISTYQVSWICLKKRDSDSQSVFCLEDNHSVDPYSVVSIMKILNLQVIDLSSDLYEDMKACGIKVKSITPDIVTTFLKSHSDVNSDSCKIDGFGNDIEMSSFKTIWNVEKLLIYCKEIRKGRQQELHRIGLSKYIILGESFVTNKPLFGALKNIELPELDSDILLRQNTSPIQSQYVEAAHKKAETMVVSYGNLSGVFECFVYNLKQYALVISEDDCFAILEYFNDNFSTLKTKFSTCEIVQKLRSCPLFISSSGNNRNISNIDAKVLVVPTTIPDDGIKEWATASGIVLLTEYTRIKPLYIKLGFIHCNASELYSKYIIQKFRNMQREAQIEHLKYIRDNLLLQGIDREFSCVQEDIIEKLSKCHFLRKDGALVCAEEFCNPRNYLFKVMCTEHEFPPFPYNVKEWENFMELIGMKMEPSSEMILRFAKTISEEGLQSLSEETEFRSSLLLQHLLTRTTLLEELKCAPFSSIRSIRFIKPYELEISNCLLRIHKQYLNRRLVSFEDCTLFRKDVLPLVWTSTHILPEYATFNTEDGKKVLEYLGVHDLPTIEHVVKTCNILQVQSMTNVPMNHHLLQKMLHYF
ncbi:SACS [Mytilus edulis]|uniref:SACS n=1 Tax=Mytilus edulis TaxID=6550 RepID=A0A8S3U2I2_MYTED|nr:SACS [Mytilus edulis]